MRPCLFYFIDCVSIECNFHLIFAAVANKEIKITQTIIVVMHWIKGFNAVASKNIAFKKEKKQKYVYYNESKYIGLVFESTMRLRRRKVCEKCIIRENIYIATFKLLLNTK